MKVGTLKALATKEKGLTRQGKVSISWARKKLRSKTVSPAVKKKLVFFLNTVAKQKTGKAARRSNPANSINVDVSKAIRLYENFHDQGADFIDKKNLTIPNVVIKVGTCDGILYTTTQRGKKIKYIHHFRRQSKPILAASADGKTLLLIGGSYGFTPRGIVDR
jgi:hypothetical protein